MLTKPSEKEHVAKLCHPLYTRRRREGDTNYGKVESDNADHNNNDYDDER